MSLYPISSLRKFHYPRTGAEETLKMKERYFAIHSNDKKSPSLEYFYIKPLHKSFFLEKNDTTKFFHFPS